MAVFLHTVFKSTVYNTDSVIPTDSVVGGHFGEDHHRHYKKYREDLERLAKIYENREKEKYVKNIEAVAEIADEIPIATPEISAATETLLDGRIPQIDYDAFYAEIHKLLAYIENQITIRESEIESDDIIALLLLM